MSDDDISLPSLARPVPLDEQHMPTSARLRQVQEALAKSQQDLTATRYELAEFRDAAAEFRVTLAAVCESREAVEQDRDRLTEDLADAQIARLATEKERDTLRLAVAVARTARTDIERERDTARDELTQLRTAVAGVLAELRELAADAQAEAAPFEGTSSKFGFGPHRALSAYRKAVALVETLGGESRGCSAVRDLQGHSRRRGGPPDGPRPDRRRPERRRLHH